MSGELKLIRRVFDPVMEHAGFDFNAGSDDAVGYEMAPADFFARYPALFPAWDAQGADESQCVDLWVKVDRRHWALEVSFDWWSLDTEAGRVRSSCGDQVCSFDSGQGLEDALFALAGKVASAFEAAAEAVITGAVVSEFVYPLTHPRARTPGFAMSYLIRHPGGPILVDTGIGRGSDEIDRFFKVKHRELDPLLSRSGFSRTDVQAIVNSHLHFDHIGNNRLFPGVPMFIQRTEWEAKETDGYTVTEWVDFHGSSWELIDGECEIAPGVVVLPTPGHTPGHQSVVVDTRNGAEVIVGQTLFDPGELDSGVSAEGLNSDDAGQTEQSARRIRQLGPVRAYFAHSHGVWQS